MDRATYEIESAIEADHWWFAGRRLMLSRLINRRWPRRDIRVLDIGTSTGTNLRLLRDLGYENRVGLDASDEAIRWCAEKGLGTVNKGDICSLPFADGSFDLILATDVIEHVDDDSRAVAEIHRVLSPGGMAILTVPAFQSLWGLQDEVSHHKRRYRQGRLLKLIEEAGMETVENHYFNYILFAPIWLARQIIRVFRIRLQSENQVNTSTLNRLLGWIFRIDVFTARHLRPPVGVSILAVAAKRHQPWITNS